MERQLVRGTGAYSRDTVDDGQLQQQPLSLTTVINEAPKVVSMPQATLWYPITPSFLETIPPGYYYLHSKELIAGKGAAEFKSSQSTNTNPGYPTQSASVKVDPEPIYIDFLKSSIDQKFKEYNQILELRKNCGYKDPERSPEEILRNLNALLGMGFDCYTPVHVDAPVVVKQEKEVALPMLRKIHNPLVPRPRQPTMLSSNVEIPHADCHSAQTQNQLRYRAVQQLLGARHEVHTKAYQELGLPQQTQTPVQQRTQVQQRLHALQHSQDQQQRLASQQVEVQQQLPVPQQCQAQQLHVGHQVQQRFQAPQQVLAQQQGYRIVARELQTQTRFANNYSTSTRGASTTQVFIYTVAPRPTIPVSGGNRQAGPELLSSYRNMK